jgi:hypothetical protein
MNPCEGIREDLVAFAFGDLSPRRMGEVGLHAGACPTCATELKEIEGTLALSALWEAPEPSPVPIRLPARRASPWLKVQIPAMAAGLLLAAGVAALVRGGKQPQRPMAALQPPAEQAVVRELLEEADRPDLADILLGSCRAEEAVAQAPVLLPRLRTYVSDPAAYLSGRTRSGSSGLRNTALVLLARLAPLQALRELPQLLQKPDATGDALRLLRQSGIDTSALVPALLRAARTRGDRVLVNEATDLALEAGAAYPLRETLEAWEALGPLQTPALAGALEMRTRRAPSPELLALLRDSRDGAPWGWAFSALAERGDPACLALLDSALRNPKRRLAASRTLDRMPAGALRLRGHDLLAAWWFASGADARALPGTPDVAEALGRRLALVGPGDGRRLLARLAGSRAAPSEPQAIQRCDAALASALKSGRNTASLLQLAQAFGSAALIPAIEDRVKADPRLRGLASTVIGSLASSAQPQPVGGFGVPRVIHEYEGGPAAETIPERRDP